MFYFKTNSYLFQELTSYLHTDLFFCFTNQDMFKRFYIGGLFTVEYFCMIFGAQLLFSTERTLAEGERKWRRFEAQANIFCCILFPLSSLFPVRASWRYLPQQLFQRTTTSSSPPSILLQCPPHPPPPLSLPLQPAQKTRQLKKQIN